MLPAAWAQQSSGIAGVVKDTSGAVLPGVTVEASSPSLIERVRAATTDGEGRYNIVDLVPGTYTVTFTLTGFRIARQEGIALSSGFTATINADLLVGTLEETVTVSGQSPLVDTHNVRKQIVATRELLDALPTSTKHINTLVTLTPGLQASPMSAAATSPRPAPIMANAAPKCTSTGWASKTVPATAATRSTPLWWRKWCCKRAASRPRSMPMAP